MILLKGIAGGVVAVFLMWVVMIIAHIQLMARTAPTTGGLGATAGGWDYLLQVPLVVLVLSAAFGVGLFLTVRFSLHG